MQASDPHRAYLAIRALVQSPGQAIDLIRKKPRSASMDRKIKQWIDELDSDRFPVRESASKELAHVAELAEAALRQSLARPLSAEARRRVTRLLDTLPTARPHPTTLATIRSLELLEMINTPEARKLIDEFSRETGDPIRKREAEQTLKRVNR
jgi:hypothetical protein